MLLEGKVAIVSGIGPGMGRDIALALAREGADIAMGARRDRGLIKVAGEVEALGRRAVWAQTDITNRADCDRLARTARDELGRVDILVNNAFSDGTYSLFEDSDLDTWRQTMDINLFGTLQMTQAVVPFLKEQDDSRIIMINSQSGQVTDETFGAYSTSKAALATATRTLARELGRHGVRVNGIHPSYIWGKSVEWYINHLADERGVDFQVVYDEFADKNCLKYLPSSAEIAGAVVFFASPLAKAVTGQSLPVNCGEYLNS
jgi:NAD(P)-dependent dehydrogenase (short-subunit alcohol dehydrogenase family)